MRGVGDGSLTNPGGREPRRSTVVRMGWWVRGPGSATPARAGARRPGVVGVETGGPRVSLAGRSRLGPALGPPPSPAVGPSGPVALCRAPVGLFRRRGPAGEGRGELVFLV